MISFFLIFIKFFLNIVLIKTAEPKAEKQVKMKEILEEKIEIITNVNCLVFETDDGEPKKFIQVITNFDVYYIVNEADSIYDLFKAGNGNLKISNVSEYIKRTGNNDLEYFLTMQNTFRNYILVENKINSDIIKKNEQASYMNIMNHFTSKIYFFQYWFKYMMNNKDEITNKIDTHLYLLLMIKRLVLQFITEEYRDKWERIGNNLFRAPLDLYDIQKKLINLLDTNFLKRYSNDYNIIFSHICMLLQGEEYNFVYFCLILDEKEYSQNLKINCDNIVLHLFYQDFYKIVGNGGMFDAIENEYLNIIRGKNKNLEKFKYNPEYNFMPFTTLEQMSHVQPDENPQSQTQNIGVSNKNISLANEEKKNSENCVAEKMHNINEHYTNDTIDHIETNSTTNNPGPEKNIAEMESKFEFLKNQMQLILKDFYDTYKDLKIKQEEIIKLQDEKNALKELNHTLLLKSKKLKEENSEHLNQILVLKNKISDISSLNIILEDEKSNYLEKINQLNKCANVQPTKHVSIINKNLAKYNKEKDKLKILYEKLEKVMQNINLLENKMINTNQETMNKIEEYETSFLSCKQDETSKLDENLHTSQEEENIHLNNWQNKILKNNEGNYVDNLEVIIEALSYKLKKLDEGFTSNQNILSNYQDHVDRLKTENNALQEKIEINNLLLKKAVEPENPIIHQNTDMHVTLEKNILTNDDSSSILSKEEYKTNSLESPSIILEVSVDEIIHPENKMQNNILPKKIESDVAIYKPSRLIYFVDTETSDKGIKPIYNNLNKYYKSIYNKNLSLENRLQIFIFVVDVKIFNFYFQRRAGIAFIKDLTFFDEFYKQGIEKAGGFNVIFKKWYDKKIKLMKDTLPHHFICHVNNKNAVFFDFVNYLLIENFYNEKIHLAAKVERQSELGNIFLERFMKDENAQNFTSDELKNKFRLIEYENPVQPKFYNINDQINVPENELPNINTTSNLVSVQNPVDISNCSGQIQNLQQQNYYSQNFINLRFKKIKGMFMIHYSKHPNGIWYYVPHIDNQEVLVDGDLSGMLMVWIYLPYNRNETSILWYPGA